MTLGKILLDPLMEDKLILNSLPPPSECQNGTIYGNYSLRFPDKVRRPDGVAVHRACVARHVVNLPGTAIFDTQTAFTRCWLKSLPPRRARQTQWEAFKRSRPPMYCQPSVSKGEAFYVDISSAYHSIYSRLSWTVEYLRGQYFSNDKDKLVFPFPLEWKTGRSYVVTAALPGTKRIIHNGRVIESAVKNPHFNSPLVCAVWDILGAIGRFAVEVYDARYYNVDGAVIPENQYYPYCQFLDSLGFQHKVKYRGQSRILNLASWQIGDHPSVRYADHSAIQSTDAIPLNLTEAAWVLERFARM